MNETETLEAIEKALGNRGNLLESSKTQYRASHPKSEVYFNACLFDAKGKQLWWGDIDFTLMTTKLQLLAKKIGAFYITPEMPYRFYGFDVKKISKDVKKFG